jgi:hypothetical protein
MPSIGNLIIYHRLRWLGKVCRMADDRLPLRLVWKDWWTRPSGSPTQNLDRVVRDDLVQLSEWHGVFGPTVPVVRVQIYKILDKSYSQA